MSIPFLGQIQLFGFNFAPLGWASCSGQLLPISQYTALFALLGTNFGGDGIRTFALPNLVNNVTVGFGTSPTGTVYDLGEQGGESTVTITSLEMASHTHNLVTTTDRGTAIVPDGSLLGTGASGPPTQQNIANIYNAKNPNTSLAPTSIGIAGGGQPHINVQPSLTLNYCIALSGTFPQRQ